MSRSQNIQDSASPLSKEHQIVPVSILVYTEYVDIEQEFVTTMQAIDNTYGTDYYYENLTNYMNLDKKLPGHDILLIPEQEETVDSDMKTVGKAWATTLTNFITDGGIIIMLDNDQKTFQIANESGLFKFYGTTNRNLLLINLDNTDDALARGVSSNWITPDNNAVCSFDTSESISVVNYTTEPIVIHKIVGNGHLVVIGCDLYPIEGNFSTILGNAIRLHQHVIFDNSHIQFENIFSGFSSFADDLVSNNFAVSSMNYFNPAYINSGDIFIVTGANHYYNDEEVDAIETFVNNGGGLFVATDYSIFGNQIDNLINRFGLFRNNSNHIEDKDDFLDGNVDLIEYDNVINHSLTLDVDTIELYVSTGFTTVPLSANIIVATDTDGTSDWNDNSHADGIPVVSTIVTQGNGRITAFSDNSFMLDDDDIDNDLVENYEDADNEVLLINSIRWLSAAGVEECIVLFDESNHPHSSITSLHLTLGNYLTDNGYTLKWMDQFIPSLINSADILFIMEGSSTGYNSIQIDTISSYVRSGGSLFLLGDLLTSSNDINPIAIRFGLKINSTAGYLLDSNDGLSGGPYITYEEPNLASHPITSGISRIEIEGSSAFTTNSTGTAIISSDTDGTCTWIGGQDANGVSIMKAIQFSSGRVVILADINFMNPTHDIDGDGDPNFFDSDNERLTVNTFQWLSEHPSSVVTGGGGNGGDDDDKDEGMPLIMLMIILGAIVGIIALAAIVLFIKKKR